MKKKIHDEFTDDLRRAYDLSRLKGKTKGKYFERYRAGTNLVLLEPDVARVFQDEKTVNKALRLLMQIAREKVPVHPS